MLLIILHVMLDLTTSRTEPERVSLRAKAYPSGCYDRLGCSAAAAPWLLWLLLLGGDRRRLPDSTRPGEGFLGESGRILFFHVPNAWASFVAFVAAGVVERALPLRPPRPAHDHAAAAAVELGLLFCVLATVTGAIWARIQWGAYWNWDPRQTSITLALLFYGAYLVLRGAVEDRETRARLARRLRRAGAGGGALPLLRAAAASTFSLHPQPVVNASGKIEMARPMLRRAAGRSRRLHGALLLAATTCAGAPSALRDPQPARSDERERHRLGGGARTWWSGPGSSSTSCASTGG